MQEHLLDGQTSRRSTKNFALPPFRHVNHNVVLLILTRFFFGLADGIWNGTVVVNFLYQIGGDNEYAGYAEAAMGIANLLIALPAGWAADRFGRAPVIFVGGLLVPIAVALSVFSALFAFHHQDEKYKSFVLFVGSLCLWGGVQAITNGPAQALYADSIAAGERSRYFEYSFVLYQLANTLGPLISVVLLVLQHDKWKLWTLLVVFLVGVGLEIVPGIFMLFFRDRYALDETGGKQRATSGGTATSPSDAAAATTSASATPSVIDDCQTGGARTSTTAATTATTAQLSTTPREQHRFAWAVPYLLFVTNFLFGIASGMTIKFFPLYFRCVCGMSPAAVQGVYTAVPFLMACFSRVGTWTAKRIGRVQVMVLFKVGGISLLVTMALLEGWLTTDVEPASRSAHDPACNTSTHVHVTHSHMLAIVGDAYGAFVPAGSDTPEAEADRFIDEQLMSSPPGWKVGVIVVIYLLRTALMNCTYPLNSSILMDFTPKHLRARFVSLSSIVRFGWCGSAALGGVLADKYGYSYTFLVTAGVQFVATILQMGLIPLVPRREKPVESPAMAAVPAVADAVAGSIQQAQPRGAVVER